jgi:hypothetical protein
MDGYDTMRDSSTGGEKGLKNGSLSFIMMMKWMSWLRKLSTEED